MTKNNALPDPQKFMVWPDRGFLPKPDPLEKLPQDYGLINDLAKDMPLLLRTRQLRLELDRLPIIDLSKLRGDQIACAMRSYSFFASAYVYATGEETAKHIPRGVAVPLRYLSKRLFRKPILSYDSYGPQNWRRVNKDGPIALGNIEVIQNFLGGPDENGFILVHVEIEANASRALCGAPNAQKLALEDNPHDLCASLWEISHSIERMYYPLLKMPVLCNPNIYYAQVRPYIHAFKSIIYEGVDEYNGEPQNFLGETGAQSAIVPCLDAMLGIEHANDHLSKYLTEMRKYIPKTHRAFIAKLELNKFALRGYILGHSNYSFLRDPYNKCVYWLWQFRKKHLEYANTYIHRQAQTSPDNPTSHGTGGTPFMEYLLKHVDETIEYRIP